MPRVRVSTPLMKNWPLLMPGTPRCARIAVTCGPVRMRVASALLRISVLTMRSSMRIW
jgi:hypothetical protein